MGLTKATITQHAWDRFIERWKGHRPDCYRRELLYLLSVAEEETLGYGATIRIIQNGFKPARYFVVGRWRFVTDEEVTRVLTAEIIWHKKKRNKPKLRDKKRYGK
jgi:hypothetical protein